MTQARVAVVTGSASGIGAATAARLTAAGFEVVGVDMMPTTAQQNGSSWVADVSDPAEVDSVFARIADQYGRIDVLVNNAGTTGGPNATVCHETSPADLERVIATNVQGPFLCARAVLPTMLGQGAGHIINVASIAGIVAFPARSAYSTSKAAVLGLTRSLAADYAPHGIRANAVCPGMVETPMTQWRLDTPGLREQLVAHTPMGRVADSTEIARAITVIASDELPFMTGHALVIDGGWTAL
jgi:NAD(P)-dependent dehydrogenase (short-subunit alcohol dehydrogenase family)